MNNILQSGKDIIVDSVGDGTYDTVLRKLLTSFQSTFTTWSVSKQNISSLLPPVIPKNVQFASTKWLIPNVKKITK